MRERGIDLIAPHLSTRRNRYQDGRKLRGDRTKRAILAKAVDVASVDGLEGLSIGRLAAELGVSKSGLFAHFGSKLELQLETVQTASDSRAFFGQSLRSFHGVWMRPMK